MRPSRKQPIVSRFEKGRSFKIFKAQDAMCTEDAGVAAVRALAILKKHLFWGDVPCYFRGILAPAGLVKSIKKSGVSIKPSLQWIFLIKIKRFAVATGRIQFIFCCLHEDAPGKTLHKMGFH